jgi:hypothetical protein
MSTGYDTATVAWGQISDPVGGWQHYFTDSVTGASKALLNVAGFQATALDHPAREIHEIRVQCSLPKLVFGQNIDTLRPDAAGQAVDKLDEVVHGYWPDAPEVHSWAVRRVDCTANRVYQGDDAEQAVACVLEALKRVRLHGRLPRVGDSGTSVSWKGYSGGFERKAYSKFYETEDERAKGILRVEVGAIGQVAVRRVLGLEKGEAVRFVDVLAEAAFPDVCTGGFGKVVGRVADQVEQQPFMRAFWKFKRYAEAEMKKGGGSGKAAAWLGYAWMVSHVGWRGLGLNQMTEWRMRKVFQEAGVDPATIDWGSFDPGAVLEDLDPEGQGALELAAGKVYGGQEGDGKA